MIMVLSIPAATWPDGHVGQVEPPVNHRSLAGLSQRRQPRRHKSVLQKVSNYFPRVPSQDLITIYHPTCWHTHWKFDFHKKRGGNFAVGNEDAKRLNVQLQRDLQSQQKLRTDHFPFTFSSSSV